MWPQPKPFDHSGRLVIVPNNYCTNASAAGTTARNLEVLVKDGQLFSGTKAFTNYVTIETEKEVAAMTESLKLTAEDGDVVVGLGGDKTYSELAISAHDAELNIFLIGIGMGRKNDASFRLNKKRLQHNIPKLFSRVRPIDLHLGILDIDDPQSTPEQRKFVNYFSVGDITAVVGEESAAEEFRAELAQFSTEPRKLVHELALVIRTLRQAQQHMVHVDGVDQLLYDDVFTASKRMAGNLRFRGLPIDGDELAHLDVKHKEVLYIASLALRAGLGFGLHKLPVNPHYAMTVLSQNPKIPVKAQIDGDPFSIGHNSKLVISKSQRVVWALASNR